MNVESMKQDFTLEITADNGVSVLNRILNVLSRRRVRIKRVVAQEREGEFHRGAAVLLLDTTSDVVEKLKHQVEKIVEVEEAMYTEECGSFCESSEWNNKQIDQTKQDA